MTDPDKTRQKAEKAKEKIAAKYGLDMVDSMMLDYIREYPKITDTELGDLVNLSRQQVNLRKNRDAFQAALNQIAEEPVDRLRRELKRLTEKYVKLCDYGCPDDSIKERAISKILTCFGVLKPVVDDTTSAVMMMVVERIKNGTTVGETILEKHVVPTKNDR